MSRVEALLSDADGTFVDTADLIRHGQHIAARSFLTDRGIPSGEIPTYEQYEKLLNKVVGGSARQTLERTVKALYEDRTHHLEGMDYDKLNSLLDPIQDRLAPGYVKAFPGLPELLSQVGALGLKMSIFSSGTPHHIVRNFGIALDPQMGEYSDWAHANKDVSHADQLKKFIELMRAEFHIPSLTVITCDDTGEHTKPDPFGLNLSMERLGVSPEQSLVLGDHAYDMQAAVNAGIEHRVGITHGFDDATTLREAGATAIISSLTELPPLLVD